jgi:predicted nuclease of predicted toxin-antitoxin system
MRILLDENVPVDLLPFLRSAGHTAESVNFIGWKGVKNGDLLARARADFDLFITRDKDFDVGQLGRYVTPQFGIVLLAIPQQRGRDYAAAFAALWPADPESLVGQTTRLPS